MENCLITKLKGTVNNTSLPFLNEIRFFCVSAENPTYGTNSICINCDDGAILKTVDNSGNLQIFVPSNDIRDNAIPVNGYSSQLTLSSGNNFIVVNNTNCEFVLLTRNKLKGLTRAFDNDPVFNGVKKNIGLYNPSQLDYCNTISMIYIGGLKGGTGVINFDSSVKLTLLKLQGGNDFILDFGVNIDTIDFTNLSNDIYVAYTASIGDFPSSLDRLWSLHSNAKIVIDMTKISGSVESLIAVLKKYNRYNYTQFLTSYMTCTQGAILNKNYTFVSNDNGNTYLVTNELGSTLGTYDTAHKVWL